ncbi:MAG: DUF4129 domain-containing protein [Candidatus Heimdallarchaeota archaeon]|nr:DUF4129 domain-containing protein [Candidatus Heimdallarchaeota archaeon]
MLVLPISLNDEQITPSTNFEPIINYQASKSNIILTSKIISNDLNVKTSSFIDNYYQTKGVTLNPTIILRGRNFIAKGQLVDTSTGSPIPIPNEEIIIFWNVFNWDDYALNPTSYRSLYAIGSGFTNSNGNFSITCASSHQKPAGLITIHTVWDGNPLYGKIEDIRQDIIETIECYATTGIILQVNPSTVRDGTSFNYNAVIGFDNLTALNAANGDSLNIEWLGNTSSSPSLVNGLTSDTLIVPNGTVLGSHILKASYNVSTLNLPYTVGTITTEAQIGLSEANWCNRTASINVFSGAGIIFDINDPVSLIPGQNPNVLRGSTEINVTGSLTDSSSNPYGYAVDLTITVDNTTDVAYVTTEDSGDFSVLFQITSPLSVGDHYLSIEVNTGQSIVATSELENFTIVGNSTTTIPTANGDLVSTVTQLVMANESVQVAGRIIDLYSSVSISGIIVYAQLGSYGSPLNTTTSGTGSYSFSVHIPPTIDPTSNNETVRIWTDSIQYYTSCNTSFQIDVFTSVSFSIKLDQTLVVDGATISSLGGNLIYNTTSFIFNLSITDQFGRALSSRDVTILLSTYSDTLPVNSNGYLVIVIPNPQITLQHGSYVINIEFTDNPTFSFGFTLVVSEQLAPTPTPTPTPTTTNGGFNLSSQFAIGILISLVSLIIIISIIYAFGRFRKSKKELSIGASGEILDLQTIMKLVAEADNAKDYQRAVILSYQAFELICMQDLRILNARSQSPRELARLVASTNRVPVRDVTMLVMRFEESRYSDHKISKNSFTQAFQALENIQLALKKEPKTTQP